MPNAQFVQYGCGTSAPPSWLNFDAGPAFWLEKKFPILKSQLVRRGFPDYPKNIHYGDIIKGLPIPERSAQAIYCSHILEHLALNEFEAAVSNTYKYLVKGGIFRLVVPDLEFYIRKYVESTNPDAAGDFMRESYLGEREVRKGQSRLLRAIFGRSAHLWMWDYKSISIKLEEAGFREIRRAAFHDNPLPQFLEVESEGRWINCLGVECIRLD